MFIGYFIGNVITGLLSDQMGRQPFIRALSVLSLVFSLLSGLPDYNLVLFLITRTIFVFGIGGMLPATYTYLAENLPNSIRSHLLCLVGLNYVMGEILVIVVYALAIHIFNSF